MPDAFFKLSAADRREALAVAAAGSGRPIQLLDKDVWLVWLLDVLFTSPLGEHLVFKGGSLLSKGYQIISRFSECLRVSFCLALLLVRRLRLPHALATVESSQIGVAIPAG